MPRGRLGTNGRRATPATRLGPRPLSSQTHAGRGSDPEAALYSVAVTPLDPSPRDDALRALFSPRAIAVLGASDDPAKIGGRPLAFLRRHGYAGALYPVNPARATVQGLQAFPSIEAIPG